MRLSAFYAAIFLVVGVQTPFWPVWLAGRGIALEDIAALFAAAIWVKVIATPLLGALADRLGRRRAVMIALAGIAVCGYAALWPVAAFWPLLGLSVLAMAVQSALMPLGDTLTLAAARGGEIDYGRVRVWGSIGFIAGSLGTGIMLGIESGESVLLLVMAASALVFLTCCKMPEPRLMARSPDRRAGLRLVLSDRRFWLFVAAAAALQASHQVYYGFGTLYWRSLGLSDTAIGWLWAEGVIAEIALFWHARRLSNRFGAVGLMALGGGAGIVRWSLAALLTSLPAIAALQLLHALTFGAVHLGAMQFITRAAPPHAAAGAQTLYAAVSAGFGSGLVMLAAGTLYARLGGYAYLPMAVLSAAGLAGALRLRTAAR